MISLIRRLAGSLIAGKERAVPGKHAVPKSLTLGALATVAMLAVRCSGGETNFDRDNSPIRTGAACVESGECEGDAGVGAPSAVSGEEIQLTEDPESRRFHDIYQQAQALGRGINLGNALEAPEEGKWGVELVEEDFQRVAQAGFGHVRLPVRFSAHTLEEDPFTLDEDFTRTRVDWAIDLTMRTGTMSIVVSFQNYEELLEDPNQHEARFLALWEQIATRYAGWYPNRLFFEIGGGVAGSELSAERANHLIGAALNVIRETNPTRAVMVSPLQDGSMSKLGTLELPADDRYLIPTFFYFNPMEFTHQGASWSDYYDLEDVDWPSEVGTEADLQRDIESAVHWASEHGRPLYLGGFGTYKLAEMSARARWTGAVTHLAEQHGIPFAYWELRSEFGAFDWVTKSWKVELLNALDPTKELLVREQPALPATE